MPDKHGLQNTIFHYYDRPDKQNLLYIHPVLTDNDGPQQIISNRLDRGDLRYRFFDKNKIRFKRGAALRKLDVDFMRAQEAGTSTTSIVADKKTLRDLPAFIKFSAIGQPMLPTPIKAID